MLKQEGRELPPAVELVWQEWHEKREAVRIEAQHEYDQWERQHRRPRRRVNTERLRKDLEAGRITWKDFLARLSTPSTTR
jgi:hypothetical protein